MTLWKPWSRLQSLLRTYLTSIIRLCPRPLYLITSPCIRSHWSVRVYRQSVPIVSKFPMLRTFHPVYSRWVARKMWEGHCWERGQRRATEGGVFTDRPMWRHSYAHSFPTLRIFHPVHSRWAVKNTQEGRCWGQGRREGGDFKVRLMQHHCYVRCYWSRRTKLVPVRPVHRRRRIQHRPSWRRGKIRYVPCVHL